MAEPESQEDLVFLAQKVQKDILVKKVLLVRLVIEDKLDLLDLPLKESLGIEVNDNRDLEILDKI